VIHDKKARDVAVTLAPLEEKAERGAPPSESPGIENGAKSSPLGVAVGEEDGQVVVERVAPDGPADGKLHRGDVIEELDHHPVTSADDLAARLRAAPSGKPVLLRVKRGDQSRYVAIAR
jgi:serine protease Do